MLDIDVRTEKKMFNFDPKESQVRSELSLSALGLFFQEQEEGDVISSAILWYEVLHPTFTIYG